MDLRLFVFYSRLCDSDEFLIMRSMLWNLVIMEWWVFLFFSFFLDSFSF